MVSRMMVGEGVIRVFRFSSIRMAREEEDVNNCHLSTRNVANMRVYEIKHHEMSAPRERERESYEKQNI